MARSLSSVLRSLAPSPPSRWHQAGVLCLLTLSLAACATPQPAPPAVAGAGTEAEAGDDGAMTPDRLEQILKVQARDVQREGPALRFVYRGLLMACVFDTSSDRMRLLAPVAQLEQVSADQRQRALEANFHTSLDARYATSGGILYAVYLHPLRSLSDAELVSALFQLGNLVRSFGTAYSSGVLHYDPGAEEPEGDG